MKNLAVVIALSARAAMFPDDFALIYLMAEQRYITKDKRSSIRESVFGGDYVQVIESISTLGLKSTRSKRSPGGIVYLPKSARNVRWHSSAPRAHAGMYAIDYEEVQRWANSG